MEGPWGGLSPHGNARALRIEVGTMPRSITVLPAADLPFQSPTPEKPRPTLTRQSKLHRKEVDPGDTPHRGPDAPGRSGVLNG